MFVFNTTNLCMPIIDVDLELDRILKNVNFDVYELTDVPVEQPDASPHELTSLGNGSRFRHTKYVGAGTS